jgi:hypothetical protein
LQTCRKIPVVLNFWFTDIDNWVWNELPLALQTVGV